MTDGRYNQKNAPLRNNILIRWLRIDLVLRQPIIAQHLVMTSPSAPHLTDIDMTRAHDALRETGVWKGCSPLELRRASSDIHSNLTIEARCAAGHFALRLPTERDGGFADRGDERRALDLAWRLGIGAELTHADLTTGVMVTRWIENATPMSSDLLKANVERLERAANLLARLHRSGGHFERTREPASVLAAYRSRFHLEHLPWHASIDAALPAALTRMSAFATGSAPCHGDAAPANFLDTPERMRLIDWEYACMSDPAWDLGYLAVEADFHQADVERLTRVYDDAAMTTTRVWTAALIAGAISLAWTALQVQASPSSSMKDTLTARRGSLTRLAAINNAF